MAREQKPKPKLPSSRGQPLTLERYCSLMRAYEHQCSKHLGAETSLAIPRIVTLLELKHSTSNPDELAIIERAIERARTEVHATVSSPDAGHTIASHIAGDFGKTKGLKVFGFGVGYGQLLFFLKKFMGARVKGVDLGVFSQEITKRNRLGVLHGTPAHDPSLRKLGKFDVTYSIGLFQNDIIRRREDALGMMINAAKMTRRRGKSYHYLLAGNDKFVPLSKKDVEARGFKIDSWEKIPRGGFFIKLTKVGD